MKKLLAALSCAAMVAAPTAASADDSVGVEIGGMYGHPLCHYNANYFRVDADAQSTFPYVVVESDGSLGGEVHCPLV